MSSMSLLRLVVSALAVLLLPSLSSAQTFSFSLISNTTGSGIWGAVQQYLRPLNRPVPYVTGYNYTDSDNSWGVAAPGTFLLWGCQPDVSFSPDGGYTWAYVSGTTATNPNLDKREINPRFPGVGGIAVGNAGCNHRGTYNRFYLMGNAVTAPGLIAQAYNTPGNATTNLWFNWATNDGSIWNQIMSNTSAYTMTNTRTFLGGSNTQNHFCVVDQKDNLYSVGAADLYMSNSLGVNWIKSSPTLYFPARWGISGGIYSPTTSTDTIVVLGGTGATSYALLNDVWSSSNNGLAWTQVTSNAPWPARQAVNFAINTNGVMVVYGGDCGGGYCGVWADAWVSVNGGSTWYLLAQQPGWNQTLTAMAFDNAGFLWLVGGQQGTLFATANSGQANDYNWTSIVQRSSLSFSTTAMTQWSNTFTGGQKFTFDANALNAMNAGANPMGGLKGSSLTSAVPIASAFSCLGTTLPNYPANGPFNLSYLNTGNGWTAVDITVAQTAAPLVYGIPWSGTSSTYDNYTNYWYGTAWAVAPTGSLMQWGGSQPDVALSTNGGSSWTDISGASTAGIGWSQYDYDSQIASTGNLASNNAQCNHRSTFNRFYVIGNNGVNNASMPFFVWAANDAQVWTQVADSASQMALAGAPLTNTVQCVVGSNDNIYYMAGSSLWVSNSLGRAFNSPATTNYFTPSRQYFSAAIYAPTAAYESIVVVGGQQSNGVWLNDVWASTNYGMSWTQQTATGAFSPRGGVNLAVSASGLLVFHGGSTYTTTTLWLSDMWVSANNGATWVQLAASTGVYRAYGGAAIDSNGYFSINSGQGNLYSWNDQVYKTTYSFNNIGQWGASVVPSLSLPSYASGCTQGQAPTTFDFAQAGSIPWSSVDTFVRPLQQPVSYVTYYQQYGGDNMNQWAVAPAGSWLLWGTQPDVSISTDFKTWTITSGATSGNTYIDPRDLGIYPQGTGNAGCNHRATYNRFYLMGSCNNYNCSGQYFNWATQDGSIWYEVMDSASSNNMRTRQQMTNPLCFVDQSNRVYLVGGADTWWSTNLGVTFTGITSSKYFTARTQMSGGIYSPTSTTDTMVILGGAGVMGDVWQTTDYAQTWTQVTASVPWTTRGNINFGISQNGVFVVVGGDLGGGSAAEYNDAWMSLTYGQTWFLLSTGGALPGLSEAAVAFDSAGYLYLFGGQSFQYNWNNAVYKSTLSFLNVTTWAPKLSGNGASPITVPSNYIAPAGFLPQGGVASAPVSVTVPTNQFSCSNIASLPQYNPNTPFDMKPINTGDGWGNAMNYMAPTVAPIVYELPWTNTSIGTWEGNQWAVAPAKSLMVWGGNSDVQLSTDGNTWTAIGGITGFPGLAGTSMNNFDQSGNYQQLNYWDTQCAHRNTVNRFYIMGNNQADTSATSVPFAGWASGDGLTWTQVMDNATGLALATDRTSNGLYLAGGQCVVDIQDNVYYISGQRTWISQGTLGVSFTPVNSTSPYMDSATRGIRFSFGAVIYTYAPMSDRILVLGGQYYNAAGNNSWINDVWASTTGGLTWTQMSASPPWTPRQSPMVAVSQSGVVVLVGGQAYSNAVANWVWFPDTWASLDNGATWTQLSASTSLGGVAYGGISIDANGYIITSGGIWSGGVTPPTWGWLNTVARSTYSINNIQQWITSVNPKPTVPAGYCAVTAYVPGTNGNGGSSSSSKLSGGAIAGIVIGSVAGVLIILLILIVLCRGAGNKKATSYETHQPEQSRVNNSEIEPSHGAVEMQETDTHA